MPLGASKSALLASAGRSTFTPATLFASGEEGVWFEPSTTTCFKATNDLTPCADTETCGFMLDLSQGARYSGGSFTGLGSELVTNGTFDSDTTGWGASGATIASVGGQLEVTPTDNFHRWAYDTLTTEAGKWYLVEFDFARGTVSNVRWFMGSVFGAGDIVPNQYIWASSGSISRIIQAVSGTTYIGLGTISNSGNTVYFDNVTIKELPGNHAYQDTAADRPVLTADGGNWYLQFNGVNTRMSCGSIPELDQHIGSGVTGFLVDTGAGNGDLISNRDVYGKYFACYRSTSNAFSYSHVGVLGESQTISENTKYVFSGYGDGTSIYSALDGAAFDSTVGGYLASSDDELWLGDSFNHSVGPLEFEGRLYATVITDDVLSSTEFDSLQSYIADKTGVTL